jgi:hypothetical protein
MWKTIWYMFYPVSMSFVEMWSLKAITSNENSEASFIR